MSKECCLSSINTNQNNRFDFDTRRHVRIPEQQAVSSSIPTRTHCKDASSCIIGTLDNASSIVSYLACCSELSCTVDISVTLTNSRARCVGGVEVCDALGSSDGVSCV